MDLTYRVQNASDFHPSVATEEELRKLEDEYNIDLHRSWITRLPSDLLVVCHKSCFEVCRSVFVDQLLILLYCLLVSNVTFRVCL